MRTHNKEHSFQKIFGEKKKENGTEYERKGKIPEPAMIPACEFKGKVVTEKTERE